MDCEQAQALLSAQLDGEVQPADAAALEAHLVACPACRATAEALRLQDADLRRAFAPRRQAAVAVAERVIARLGSAEQQPARPAHRLPRRRWLPMGLSAAAGFLIAVLIFRPWETPPEPVQQVRTAVWQPKTVQLNLATGDVETTPSDRDAWQPRPPGSRIAVGDRVRTPAYVCCELRTEDGSEVRVNGGTELQFHSERQLSLTKGQILASVVENAVPFVVQIPQATVTALGTQFDLSCQPAQSTLVVLQGSTQVAGAGAEDVVQTGEVARIVNGQVAEKRQRKLGELDLLTGWVNQILRKKARDNAELERRVNDILAQAGQTKEAFMDEDEIRGLGDACVLPLTRYLQSPRSRGPDEQRKRVEAAHIVADLAQPWSIPDLIGLLSDSDPDVRFWAARGLERLTKRTLGRSAEQWRDTRREDLTPDCQDWQSWWQKNKDRYPAAR